MRDGDVLLEVNGETVESLQLREIVDRVRQSGQRVSVTTITPRGLEFYTKVGGRHTSPLGSLVQQNPEGSCSLLLPPPVSCSCSWACPLSSSVRTTPARPMTEGTRPQLSRRHRRKQADPDSAACGRARWALAFIWAAPHAGLGPLSAR